MKLLTLAMHRCLASIYYFIRTGSRSARRRVWQDTIFLLPGVRVTGEGRGLHIKKISTLNNEHIPSVLGILVFGILCIICGLYLAFFYAGISHLTSNPLQFSPYDVVGNLLIFAGIIILLLGSYRQKNSPVY